MKKLIVFLLIAAVAGCATPYQELGEAGGYLHQRLDENVYKITFFANGFTEYKRARDFAFLRAAEVGAELGYTHFVIEGQEDRSKMTSVDMGSTSHTQGTGYGYGSSLSYYGTTSTYHNRVPVLKPGVELVARYFDGTPTGRYLEVFEARSVIATLSQKYNLDIRISPVNREPASRDESREPSAVGEKDDSTPAQRSPEPTDPNVPARKVLDYKLKRDAAGNFVKDKDGNFVLVPIYEDEQKE